MKKIILYSLLFLTFTSCSHRIIRTGYQVNKSDYSDCDIVIKKQMLVSDSVQKVGEIKLGESGFSVACSEADAIEILKREGCALKADIINITEETRSDLWSSCYRCKADFYSYLNPEFKAQSDEIYNSEDVKNRVSKDRGNNTLILVGSVVAGFLFGFFVL
ncbi:MAG: hypothetical protein K0M40_03000 [Prolixibacteraceae bacterium]|nr:hypothetical protein [Prolixibacteraceae bacterium]